MQAFRKISNAASMIMGRFKRVTLTFGAPLIVIASCLGRRYVGYVMGTIEAP